MQETLNSDQPNGTNLWGQEKKLSIKKLVISFIDLIFAMKLKFPPVSFEFFFLIQFSMIH